MQYEVVYKSRGGELSAWTPAEGVPFECDRAEAEIRFGYLRAAGLQRCPIDKMIPWYVAIMPKGQGVAIKATYTDEEGMGRERELRGGDPALN